jgi:hypothetical protein
VAAGDSSRSACRRGGYECDFVGAGETGAGWTLVGLGALHAIVGIPLWAVGASFVPTADKASPSAGPRGEAALEMPGVRLGLGSVTLDWRF